MFIVDNKNKMKPFFGGRLMAVFYFLLNIVFFVFFNIIYTNNL